uniref:Uncharacterized protein n=1 Tax=Brassica campestris TaxID=3711 RepID=A0A3P6BUG9_BRACM|nr:unnamed protein product [Brassica rapa]
MSFRGDRIDDETPLFWSPEYIFELPEPCLPLRQQHCFCAHTLSTRLHNYMPHQTYVPITSAFTINGQQLPPSVLAIRRNEAHNLRTVNNSARHHVNMQRRLHQSSSSFRVSSLYTLLRRRPSANSSIPPQNEVIGSRRRTYESRFQFGEPSSSTRRRRTTPADGSVGSTAINPTEERRVNGLYDPEYQRQGLCIDPHLRNFLNQ